MPHSPSWSSSFACTPLADTFTQECKHPPYFTPCHCAFVPLQEQVTTRVEVTPATAVAITQAETPVKVSALHPHTYMHMYQCHLSPLMSQQSPPLPHPLSTDSGGDMPEEWQGSDALHPPSPGGGSLLLYVVGLPLSPPPSPLTPYLCRSLPPSFPLPLLTFPPSIEFAGVVVVFGQFCSKIRLLCYAPTLLWLAVMLWVGYCCAPLTGYYAWNLINN